MVAQYWWRGTMGVTDSGRALGAVEGKALTPFDGGRGSIPVLIALQ